VSTGEQKSSCVGNPCKNGGTCTPDGSKFTCACKPYYDGNTCDSMYIYNLITYMCYNV